MYLFRLRSQPSRNFYFDMITCLMKEICNKVMTAISNLKIIIMLTIRGDFSDS